MSKKSIFENFQKNSKIFIRSHRSEILSYEAGKGLKISAIAHTFRLEANKSPYASLNMIKNTKHPAEKLKKIIFPLSREKNSFSKSPYSKNFAEKIKIFPKFCFIEKLWTFLRRMSALATL